MSYPVSSRRVASPPIRAGAALPGRLLFVDAARGAAMFFVLLRHFGEVYFTRHHDVLPEAIQHVGMIASPTFMILSGLMLGFLCTTRPSQADALKAKLVDRGLFLLIIGHVLITGAFVIYRGTIRWEFITDTIGFSMIAGAYLIGRMTPRARLFLSGSVYVLSWIAIGWWHPEASWARLIRDTFFGSAGESFYAYSFPVLPWFSLYFASTVIGERLGACHINGDERGMSRTLGMVGLGSLGAVVFLKVAARVLAPGMASHGGLFSMLISIDQKLPPSPAYLLFFGGMGLALLSAFHLAEQRHRAGRIFQWTTMIGQSSLFVFVLQFYVYYAVLSRLHLQVTAFWPAYLMLSAVFIVLLARVYHRAGYRRFLTVGYPGFWTAAAQQGTKRLETVAHTAG